MNIQDVLIDVKCSNVKELETFMKSLNKCAVYNLIVDFSGIELSRLIDNSYNIAKVTFTDNVKELKDYSLECCNHVVWVQLPKNLEYIGDYSFYGCESLRELNIPKSVKVIGDSAFNGCITLKELRIPKAKLPIDLICDCRKLETLILPNREYFNKGFYNNLEMLGCKKLKNIIFDDEK